MYYTLHLNSKIICRICAGVKMVNVWNVELLLCSLSILVLPQNCSTKSIQWSLSRIPVTRRPPNRRHSIIFVSCIMIVISSHGRWKVWVSGLHLLVFNSIQEVFNSNNEPNQCFVLSQTCIKSYLSTAAVRSAGSRIDSPVLKTRTISRKPTHCILYVRPVSLVPAVRLVRA